MTDNSLNLEDLFIKYKEYKEGLYKEELEGKTLPRNFPLSEVEVDFRRACKIRSKIIANTYKKSHSKFDSDMESISSQAFKNIHQEDMKKVRPEIIEGNFSRYFNTVVGNACRDQLRKYRREEKRTSTIASVSEPDDHALAMDQIASRQPLPSEYASHNEIASGLEIREIKSLLESLSIKQLKLLQASLNDITYKEMGKACGMKEGTVRSALHKARKVLWQCVPLIIEKYEVLDSDEAAREIQQLLLAVIRQKEENPPIKRKRHPRENRNTELVSNGMSL